MSERREGHNATRRQTMKRWKVALVAVLTIAMVMQSSNVQAIAEGIAGEGRPPMTDTMLTDGTGTDEATGTDAATGTEDVTTDETAEDTTSTEATTPETDEAATDTEATEEESTDAPAAPEEVVEDTTETEAPAEAPAEEADTTVTLNVEISGAKLTYKAEDGTEQNVTPETDPKSFDVPNTLDFKFTVTPDDGQKVSSVSYGETVLDAGDETGEYTVATADLTDGEKIVVTTEAVPAEETPAEEAPAEEAPAEPEAPAESEVATEPTEDEATPEEPTTDDTAEDAMPAEPEVLDPEEVVADVSSPAYEGYAYVGDIVVKVTAAEGVLPEGTTVSAYQVNRQDVIDAVSNVVEQNGKVVENSVAIDVTLLGPDGNVIQPDGAVNVCFFNTSFGGGEVDVYRVSDDASTVQAVGTRQADSDVQSFDVNHFSIYVGAEIKAAATYEFYNGDSCVATQLVKDGDLLVEPASPTADGKTFLHWAINGTQLNFDQAISVSEPGLTVRVDAVFADAAYIFFMDGVGEGARVVRTKRGVAGATDTVDDVTFPVDASHGITGWYYDQSLDNPVVNNSVTYGIEPIILYPKVDEGHYITFVSNGGSYVAPDFYLSDEHTVKPDDPTRAGYDFKEWTTDEEGNTPFNWGQAINGSITLYAQWDARRDTKYTVIYWVENANDEEYSFYKSESHSGVSGEMTNVSPRNSDIVVQGAKDIFGEDVRNAQPYHVSTENEVENQVIAGDGSTIVNVYYDRTTYDLVFKTSNGRNGRTVKTITLKWGQDVPKEDWPQSDGGNNWQIKEATGGIFGIGGEPAKYLAYTSTMPCGGGTLWYPGGGWNTYTGTYYVEALSPDDVGADGSRAFRASDGRYYVFHHRDSIKMDSTLTIGEEDCYAIAGYTHNESLGSQPDDYYDNAKFYYVRDSFDIIYINGSTSHEKSYKYGSDISQAGKYEPSRPSGIPANYEFQGWYADPEGTTPYAFAGKMMPANNITVYAKWSAPTHTVNFYAGLDAEEPLKTLEVGDIAVIDPSQEPEVQEPDGYSFFGWATKDADGNLTLFNMNEAVQDDLDLYPYFVPNGSAQVVYDSNGSEGSVSDGKRYAQDTYADVQSADGLVAPEGKVFVGWNTNRDGLGTTYYPGAKLEITASAVSDGTLLLYAQWADIEKTATVTYHSNYPVGVADDDSTYQISGIPNNDTLEALDLNTCHFVGATDYLFLGWSRAERDTDTLIQPGEDIQVTTEGSNDLYAQWKAKPSIVDMKVDSPKDETYDGDAHKWAPTVTDGETVLAEGTDYEVEYSTDNFTDVTGAITVTITGKGNYTGEVTRTYQITPATITVTADDKTKVFGESDPELTHTDGAAVKEEKPAFTGALVRDEGEQAGQSYTIRRGDLALADNLETGFKASNYEVSFQEGTLTITEKGISTGEDMKVDSPKDETYDGDAHKWAPTVTDGETVLAEGTDYEVEYSTDNFTDVTGAITVTITGKGNYTGEVTRTYQITPAQLKVTTPSASKVYDGTALTADGSVDGLVKGETVDFRTTGSQTEVGQSQNTYALEFTGTALETNYTIASEDLGTLTVFPQSIDPSDPDPDNPEPGDPDPNDPDPENPDQPFYTGVSVDSPSDVVYDGADHTWTPTVTDGDGNVLVAKRDYTVSYSTTDRTNVTGTITVTITGTGNFAGTVTRTYQVVPRPLVVQANDQTKVQGAADPALSSGYNPAQLVAGEEPGWTGGLTREAGEAVGTYAITQGTLALEDNGDFLAANYVLTVLPGTLTITAAPAPDNPPATTDDGGDDTPTTPAGPTNPVPDDTLPVTDDATTDDATPEETVTDDENPLASGDEEGIEENGNPLASGRGDEDCWVHWLILVGMILTAVYFVGVAVRRRKFTADLLDYEDKVLGNNRNDA